MYNYNYGNPSTAESFFTTASAITVILIIFLIIIIIAAAIFLLVSNCIIFKKAGEKSWKGIIPFYNIWIETKFSGLAWWWYPIFIGLTTMTVEFKEASSVIGTLLLLVEFNLNYNIAKKFGKSNGFALLCTLLPIIGLPILAFGKAEYNKDAKVDENGIFPVK